MCRAASNFLKILSEKAAVFDWPRIVLIPERCGCRDNENTDTDNDGDPSFFLSLGHSLVLLSTFFLHRLRLLRLALEFCECKSPIPSLEYKIAMKVPS